MIRDHWFLLLVFESISISGLLGVIFIAEEVCGVLVLFTICSKLLIFINFSVYSIKFNLPFEHILLHSSIKVFHSLLFLLRRFYHPSDLLYVGIIFLLLSQSYIWNYNLSCFGSLMSHEKVGTSILIVVFISLIFLMDLFFILTQPFNIFICLQIPGHHIVVFLLASGNESSSLWCLTAWFRA